MTAAATESTELPAQTRAAPWFRAWQWYLGLRAAPQFLVVALTASLLIFARRPEQLIRPEFYGEDGAIFYVGTYFGNPVEVLFRPYAGYDNLATRLLAYLERAVPIAWAPLVANLGAIVLVGLLAAFVASRRLQAVIPNPMVRLGLAALLVCLPNSVQTLGIAADLMRYVPIFLLALSLATVPVTLAGRATDVGTAALASLTGPTAVFMAPLFWWRYFRAQERHVLHLAAVVSLGSALQLITVMTSGRNPANFNAPSDLVRAFVFRSSVQSLLGTQVSALLTRINIPLVVGFVSTVLVVSALVWVWYRAIPPNVKWPIAWTFASITLASAAAQTEGGPTLLYVITADRYFFVSTAMVAIVVLAGYLTFRHGMVQRAISIGLASILCVGIGGDLRLYPFPTYDWTANSACIGGPAPCRVDVYPPPMWTIHWPGAGGTYDQPRPGA